MNTSTQLPSLHRWKLPTAVRLAWLEWRAVGWPGSGALLAGGVVAAMSGLDRTTAPADAGFLMVVTMAATLGLALALMPSPRTDQAWELTALGAGSEGGRQWRSMAAALLLTLLVLALLAYTLSPAYAPWKIWGWFAPRAAWFAAPALLVL